jgi:membrane protease YdiL (CAAX protease family)
MTAGVADSAPSADRSDRASWIPLATGGLALVGGVAIFVVGSPYFEITSWNDDPVYNGFVAAVLGLMTLSMRGRPGVEPLRAACHALFIAATAMFVMVVGPFNWIVTLSDESYQHAVQDKLAQFLAIVPVIVILTWAARRPWSWLYVQTGSARRWLTLGLSTFVIGATIITVVALAAGIAASDLIAAAPWILVFAALNAVMEELWFRGIFLRPYTAGMGVLAAVIVTGIVFGAAHVGATYVSAGEQLLFAGMVAGLGILLALAIRWADAIWGAVLIHITLDLVVVLELVDSV